MEHVELTVRGEGAGDVPSALRAVAPDSRFDYDGDGFAVVVTERFFYRINSSVQTTVVFELDDTTTLSVTVVSGGGAAGLAKVDNGAESSAARKLVEKIEAFCRQHDLEVERH